MRSNTRRVLVVSTASGFLIGVVVASWINSALLFAYGIAAGAFVVLVWGWSDPRLRLIAFGVLAVASGVTRTHMMEQNVVRVPPSSSWTGVIRSDVVFGERSQAFTVALDHPPRAMIRVVARPAPAYQYGDWVTGACGSVADDGSCIFPTMHRLGSGRGHPLRTALLSFRSSLLTRIEEMVSQPEAGIVSAYVLGDQHSLSQPMREVFRRTGTSHIVAISGAHMVILAQIVLVLLTRLPVSTRQTGWGALAILSFFTLLIGAPSSAVRGLLFSWVLLGAWIVGRQRAIGHTLLVVAVGMLVVRPDWLFDLGFQLSFLATAGLVYGIPLLHTLVPEKWRVKPKEHPWVFFFVYAALASVAATITTTPLVLATIGRTSIIALPVNIIVAPALTPLLVVALIAIPLLYVPWVGSFASIVVTSAFGAFRFMLEAWARIPGAYVEVTVTPVAVVFLYALMTLFIAYIWFRYPWIQKLSVGQQSGSS